MTAPGGDDTMAQHLALPVDDDVLDQLGRPRGRRQPAAAKRMQDVGRDLGGSYPYIWAPFDVQREHLSGPVTPAAGALAKGLVANAWPGILTTVGVLTLLLFLASVLTRGSAIAGYFALGWLAGVAVLVVGYLIAREVATATAKRRGELAYWLSNIGMVTAGAEIFRRRSGASDHQPGDGEFVPVERPPAPSVYGASPEGVVQIAAAWMRYYGEGDAEPVVGSTSSLIGSLHYLAGVASGTEPVDEASIHELIGRAIVDGRRPAYFATNSYNEAALAIASQTAVPLFVFDPVQGTITGASQAGFDRLRSGL
jgi:hypothetical protein